MKTLTLRGLSLATFSLVCSFASAQQEASIWFLGGGYGLDFTKTPTPQRFTIPADEYPVAGYATIADGAGNLIFYTNGQTVFNSNDQVLQDGRGLLGTGYRQVIIPKPGTSKHYYIFYIGSRPQTQQYNEVMYAIVDMAANLGHGKVIEKNTTLYGGLHGWFAVSGGCKTNDFWFLGEADRNVFEETDKIYAYHVTVDGIAPRVVSMPVSIGNSGGYKFSPDGRKITFFYNGNPGSAGTALADFNPETGVVSNARNVGPCCGLGEFSPEGKFLYVNYFSPIPGIRQHDLEDPNFADTVIAELPPSFNEMQLGPNGKIYMFISENDGSTKLGVINNPSLRGSKSNFEIGESFAYNGGIIKIPQFPSTAFYQSPYRADAGTDKDVCVGQEVEIGGANSIGPAFKWSPETYLDNPNSSHPTFRFDGHIEAATTLTYTMEIVSDACTKQDTVQVVVHPSPSPKIYGSRSVCPAVEGVLYWTDHEAGTTYQWAVKGGVITGSLVADTIAVNWGPTNPMAKVKLVATSEFDCQGDEVIFPVWINVELDTDTPDGLRNVCNNLRNNNVYQILKTNGSIYTWGINGGEIKKGQGSNKVTVDWSEAGPHELWVTEKSVTIDTICFGSSDTLRIHVYTDSLQAVLHAVSVDQHDDTKTWITGTLIDPPLNNQSPLRIFRKSGNDGPWVPWLEEPTGLEFPFSYIDNDLDTDENIYSYQIQTINGCLIDVESIPHHTMQLDATADETRARISLSWNAYTGWPGDVERYEIWRMVDDDTVLTYLSFVGPQVLTTELLDAGVGFQHHIRIKAVAHQQGFYSWSNQQDVKFEHPLFIPNVFTPNGDHTNETFDIHHIDLYSPNELIIYNRWGEKVYSQDNYRGDWSAEGLPAGTYYFKLIVDGNSEMYKGWVQVIR